MYVENANRALKNGYITVDNLEPNPKNPIIAAFFRNIGYADQLGSGVRNLFKYTKYYSGQEPQFIEGDVFRIIVPLDDSYSFDFGSKVQGINGTKTGTNGTKIGTNEKLIIEIIKENPTATQAIIHDKTGMSLRTIKRIMAELKKVGVITRTGSTRSGEWHVIE